MLLRDMGFGSYDESEQENREIDTENIDDEGRATQENEHKGSVEFDIGASNEDLLDQLQDIKD